MRNYPDLIVKHLSDPILVIDRNGLIRFAAPSIRTLAGYDPDELEGRRISIFSKDEEDVVRIAYELSLAQKKGHLNLEGWKKKKDGSHFWGELSVTPIPGGTEEEGYLCMLRDLTERKKKELAVRQSEERYRLMVEGVKDYAIFMLDPQGHILTWNDGAKKTKGYSANEIIGKHFSIFYTAEDLDSKKPERELKIAVATGKYEEEGWRVKKNGSLFWANVVITALLNDRNELIGFSKVTRDLSERKANDEALRQSEERYRSLVEQVKDYGIFMMDEKGRIISWNEGAKRINGYTAEEIIGKYFSIFYPQEDILNNKPAHELEVAKTEGKYEEEGWRIRKDGTRFWANVVIAPIRTAGNAIIGFSKVTRDLTERRLSEKALRESYEKYFQLADQLRATNSELTVANKELQQFTSIVSHDLQEPIRTIKSFLQLIEIRLNAGQTEDLHGYVGKSITAANRMKDLILNLLHYSQLSKAEPAREVVKVKDLLNDALQNLKDSIDKSGVEIEIDNTVDTITGDPVQLLQLIQNLISNAIKFTRSQHPRVRIRCIEEDGTVKFAVSDNGIGIASGDLQKVFEIFRRLNNNKDFPGTGIGLAICKKIVERHNGRIWPESEPGKGTTFYFTLGEEHQESLHTT